MAVIKVYNRINWLNKSESLTTPLGKTNLNKMDKAIDTIDNEVVSISATAESLDTTKADKDQLNNMITDIAINDKNGVISITKYNGTVLNIDTAMEKIAVNFEYNAQTQQLILTLENGEKQYIDMSALITQYEFKGTDTIAFSIDSDGKVNASIKRGSITKAMLSSEVMSAITLSESNAVASAHAAAQSATNADMDAKLSQSYSVGKSGIRDGEDTDNAKYYSEQAEKFANEAKDIVGSNFITQAEKGVAGGVAELNDNLAVAKAVADEDGNNIQGTYAKKTEIAEVIEVDSELSTTSTNPVQNKIVTAAINSARHQVGIANGILTQWQEQGRIPNGIVNNLVTTEEGYALDARQGEALDGKITELKKSVSDGKSAIASAITNEGVSTASDASFETMVENIGKIFYKRLGTQLPKYYYANVHATSGSQSHQYIYRNANTTTKDDWLGHEEFFGGSLPALNGCIIITWLRGIGAFTIMRLKSSFLGVDNFETLYSNALHYYHPDGGTINLVSTEIKPGVEICTLCLACHS